MHAQRGGKMCQWGFSIDPFKVFELTYSKNKSIEIESSFKLAGVWGSWVMRAGGAEFLLGLMKMS